jgi:HEAT repeat protein
MIDDLLDRARTELVSLACTGFANTGPASSDLNAIADDMTAAGLGKLGERLQAVAEAAGDQARASAWAAAWAGVALVRTRLLKPHTVDIGDAVTLPQAHRVLFPRPKGDLDSLDGLLAVLRGPNPLARAYAAGRLVEFGDEAVPGLLQTQKQCGRCIRLLAIDALGRIGTDAALVGLVDWLGDRDVARPLEAALLGLGKRSAPLVAEALEQTKASDRRRRQACAKLLWRLEAAEHLKPYLKDENEMVKAYAQAAIWTGGHLEDRSKQQSLAGLPASVALFEQGALLFNVLAEQFDQLAKNHLADAAAVLWHTGAEEPVLAHHLPLITEGRRKSIRERAAAMVIQIANRTALPSLLHLLETETDPAVDALAKLADSSAIGPLIQVARQKAPHQRDAAILALGRIGDPAAISALLQMLEEAPSRASKDAFEKALVAIGVPAVGMVSQTLLGLDSSQAGMAPPLERVLTKIKTPEAKAALEEYRANTDDLTRLLSHLADGKVTKETIKQVVELGTDALEPLLDLAVKGRAEGQRNAIRALGKMARQLSEEQRGRIIETFRGYLQKRRPQQRFWGYGWMTSDPVVEDMVKLLCQLDASVAAPEIKDSLVVAGVGKAVLGRWRKTSQTWLLDIIVRGIQTPDTRYQAIHIAQEMTINGEVIPQLWTAVEAVLQSEKDAYKLQVAVSCLRSWGDPRGASLLQQLKRRWGTVTGHTWFKNRLEKEVNDVLAVLNAKRPLLGRLLGI